MTWLTAVCCRRRKKDDNKNNESNESNENNWTDDWSETISAVKNGQDEQRGNPDWYMFTGENYIVRTDDTASEIAIQMPVTRGMILQ